MVGSKNGNYDGKIGEGGGKVGLGYWCARRERSNDILCEI